MNETRRDHMPVAQAAAKTVLTCAVLHLLLLAVRSLAERDPSVWNAFAIIEAQRVWPALAPSPGTQALSGALTLLLFAGWLGHLQRRNAIWAPARQERAPRVGGVAAAIRDAVVVPFGDRRVVVAVPPEHPPVDPVSPRVFRPGLALALGIAALGVAIHMTCLAAIERLVTAFPSIPDVFQARLPYVDFGLPGELVFAAFVVTMLWRYIRTQAKSVPSVICLLGAFYAIRGVFLFLMPIGSPPTAHLIADRFVLYPYAQHAFFPGGHAGLMTILSLALQDRRWRRGMLAVTAAFALGTVIARAHYTADVIGGALVGYAIVAWGRRHLSHLGPGTSSFPSGRAVAPRPVAVRTWRAS